MFVVTSRSRSVRFCTLTILNLFGDFCTLRKEIQFTHSIFNSDPDAISLSNEMLNYKIVELVEGAGLVAASGESSLGHTESVH